MIYFEKIALIRGFINSNLINKKKSVLYSFRKEDIEIYMKNSTKRYNSLEEIIYELKESGFLYEINQYNGIYPTETKGYLLFLSNLMKCLNQNDEYLNNDLNLLKLLTINQVCDILNISRPSAYKLINNKELPYIEIFGQKRIQYVELLKFIQNKTRT